MDGGVGFPAGIPRGSVGWREQLAQVGWGMFSWPTQPGGAVPFGILVDQHLAGSRPLLPLQLPLLPLPSSLSPGWLLSIELKGRRHQKCFGL